MSAEASFLLDTNVCIDLLAGSSERLSARVSAHEVGELVTSAVVHAEVMIGARSRGSIDAAAALFALVPAMPFDAAAGDAYALLPSRRGSFDRLIAAHALSLGLTLVTNNEADFADVPGLRIENWTA